MFARREIVLADGTRLLCGPLSTNTKKVSPDWEELYDLFGMRGQLGEFLAENKIAFLKMPVLRGVTAILLMKTLENLGIKVETQRRDLDGFVPFHDRDPSSSSYAVFYSFHKPRKRNCATCPDEEKLPKKKPITLIECLLLEAYCVLVPKRQVFRVKGYTPCSGSHSRLGDIPSVIRYPTEKRLKVLWGPPVSSSSPALPSGRKHSGLQPILIC